MLHDRSTNYSRLYSTACFTNIRLFPLVCRLHRPTFRFKLNASVFKSKRMSVMFI